MQLLKKNFLFNLCYPPLMKLILFTSFSCKQSNFKSQIIWSYQALLYCAAILSKPYCKQLLHACNEFCTVVLHIVIHIKCGLKFRL